jgi:hypothetical protein
MRHGPLVNKICTREHNRAVTCVELPVTLEVLRRDSNPEHSHWLRWRSQVKGMERTDEEWWLSTSPPLSIIMTFCTLGHKWWVWYNCNYCETVSLHVLVAVLKLHECVETHLARIGTQSDSENLTKLKREILLHQARSTRSSQETVLPSEDIWNEKTSFDPFPGKAGIKRLIYGDMPYISNFVKMY